MKVKILSYLKQNVHDVAKIVKYVKVNNNCNRFIVEEALSHYLYKFITKEPFVF